MREVTAVKGLLVVGRGTSAVRISSSTIDAWLEMHS